MTTKLKTYRVWMKDGYCGLYNAADEAVAKAAAVAEARTNCEGAALTPAETRKAVAVDYVEKLS